MANILSSSGPIVNVKSKLGPEIGSVMAWLGKGKGEVR